MALDGAPSLPFRGFHRLAGTPHAAAFRERDRAHSPLLRPVALAARTAERGRAATGDPGRGLARRRGFGRGAQPGRTHAAACARGRLARPTFHPDPRASRLPVRLPRRDRRVRRGHGPSGRPGGRGAVRTEGGGRRDRYRAGTLAGGLVGGRVAGGGREASLAGHVRGARTARPSPRARNRARDPARDTLGRRGGGCRPAARAARGSGCIPEARHPAAVARGAVRTPTLAGRLVGRCAGGRRGRCDRRCGAATELRKRWPGQPAARPGEAVQPGTA